jgi:Uma2 family endonuclease
MAQARSLTPKETPPPLNAGDHLTREEFERRWDMHAEIKKAELIEGVVYLEVTVSRRHANPHTRLMTWLGTYVAARPDLEALDNVTVRFEGYNDLQPDGLIRLLQGGDSTVSDDDCVQGPPELVVEVAASSAAYDMHIKKDVYRRNHVAQYLVWQEWEKRLDWWELRDGKYVDLPRDESGVIESKVFPGLRLDVPRLLEGDMQTVLAELQASS